MFTTTHASPAIAKKNLSKFISISVFIFVFIANMNISSANANILTSVTGTQVMATPVYSILIVETECGSFTYQQRVIIDGQAVMVATDRVIPTGKHQLTFYGTCNGLNLYGVGTCGCFNTRFMKFEFLPIMKFETAPEQQLEKMSKEIFNAGKKCLAVAPSPGDLWKRENC